tara:strand:- start:1051 stop:1359 length:309 start_codon:yes stop_codon:yes gene_type:complete
MIRPKLTNFADYVVKPKPVIPKTKIQIQKQTSNYLTIALFMIICIGFLSIYIRYKTKQSQENTTKLKLSQLNNYIQDHMINDMLESQKNNQHTIYNGRPTGN